MILIDFSPVAIANCFELAKEDGMNADLIRHVVLVSLLGYRKRHKREYGELVLAFDSRSWRYDCFPYYKANRKKQREDNAEFWETVGSTLSSMYEEIRQNFPYKCLKIDGAEADDIIGAVVRHRADKEKILLVSGDKDFCQLHPYGIEQIAPVGKEPVKVANVSEYVFQHVIKGDTGDGVPNFLSPDNAIVVPNYRQSPVSAANLERWFYMDDEQIATDAAISRHEKLAKERTAAEKKAKKAGEPFESYPIPTPEALSEMYLARIERNRKLVLLDNTPQTIQDEIIAAYDGYDHDLYPGKLMDYLMRHQLVELIKEAQHFV